MASLAERTARRAAYGAAATAKVGWYGLHYAAGRRVVGPMTSPGEAPRPMEFASADLSEMQRLFRELFEREARDVGDGVYAMPLGMRRLPNPLKLARDSRDYIREAKAVSRRAHAKGGGVEVRERADRHLRGVPGYYHQNFHFQTDGWLSEGSAAVYDTQVETLFTGSADAMRRRALPFLRAEVDRLVAEGREPSSIVFADVGCGTGRLLGEVAANHPEIAKHAVDLSPPYLNAARRNAGSDRIAYTLAPAERLPFADGSVDVLATVYLFHELPPKVRRQVAAEFARVLRPGGLYLHTDSIQYGDTGLDVLLESFPRVFHEPYYDTYAREDLDALFGEAGLVTEGEEVAFLTKVTAMRRAGMVADG